jgi:hypothetical protein
VDEEEEEPMNEDEPTVEPAEAAVGEDEREVTATPEPPADDVEAHIWRAQT